MFLYFVLILILDIEVPRENVEVRLDTGKRRHLQCQYGLFVATFTLVREEPYPENAE